MPGVVPTSSTTPIPAKVMHKIEGTELHVPIESTLDGPASLTPARIDVAPGTFTYVAPGVPDNVSTLTFTSTSRRGIGKVSATARTVAPAKVCQASGGQNIAISGTICGALSDPFALNGLVPDGKKITFSYSPAGETGGTYTYSGGASGITVSGTGTYTIRAGSGDTLILKQSDNGCVTNIPGGTCAAHTNEVTLTPIASCS